MTRATLTLALIGVLALAGCADPAPTDAVLPPPPASTETAASPGDPTAPAPITALLDWEPALRPVEETVTAGGGWRIVVDQERSLATIDGPHPRTIASDKRFRVSDVLLDTEYAVVVTSDTLEERPAVATVIDLATGGARRIDGRADVPTTTGGTWALHGARLVHATVEADGAYCLAERDLAADTATISWCAEPRHGFTSAHLTAAGLTVTGFDDQRPSCRSVGELGDGVLEPFPDVTGCSGWEGVVTDGGAVWSVIAKENNLEASLVYARTAAGVVELGPASAGTLTWCGGATYFVRDPQARGEPARLLRWTDAGAFETVYETKGGPAFLSAPRCGGDRITVTSFAESGDEQVSAPLG